MNAAKIIALIALTGCASESGAAADAAPETEFVAVLGDSTAMSWPPLVQELRPDLYVLDYAAGGSTTAMVGNQWRVDIKPLHHPRAIVVLGGIVDILQNQPGGAFDNLESIYTDAQAAGVDVYALTVLPSGATYTDHVVGLDNRIRGADVVVIDLYDEFVGHPELYADTTHPNADGMARIANAVAGAVR